MIPPPLTGDLVRHMSKKGSKQKRILILKFEGISKIQNSSFQKQSGLEIKGWRCLNLTLLVAPKIT